MRLCALDAECRATGLNVCPAGFQSCFGLIPHYFHAPSFWNGNAYLGPLYWKYAIFFLILIEVHSFGLF